MHTLAYKFEMVELNSSFKSGISSFEDSKNFTQVESLNLSKELSFRLEDSFSESVKEFVDELSKNQPEYSGDKEAFIVSNTSTPKNDKSSEKNSQIKKEQFIVLDSQPNKDQVTESKPICTLDMDQTAVSCSCSPKICNQSYSCSLL